jgi:hypothetical protein
VPASVVGRQCLGDRTRGVTVDVGDDDPPVSFGECRRDGPTDAGAGAGNYDCLGHV